MSTNYTEIGTTAVFDAQNITVGSLVEIEGQLLRVDHMIGTAVYYKVVVGREKWAYRTKQVWQSNKAFILTGVVIVLSVLAYKFGAELFV